MRRIVIGAVGLVASAGSAGALGLDRSGQDITAIFEPGGFAEVTYALANPTLEGFDVLGTDIEDVGDEFSLASFAVKYDTAPGLSIALIVDQPYGADIAYGGESLVLGGTVADLTSVAYTTLVRYQFNEAFSIHGGVRNVNVDADVTLSGGAFGALSGYNVELDDGQGYGYVIGGAYERPEIALRVALTYSSAVELDFDTFETGAIVPPGAEEGTTTVTAPESINLDFQTGIARDTLLFGQIRHATYSDTIVSPDNFAPFGSITDIEDGTAYLLGVGRRFTDSFAGQIAVGYEPETGDSLVSPLAPTNGQTSIQVGGAYTVGALTFSGGVRYTMLGDAQPETGTPDTARATFEGSDAVSLALAVAYRF